MRHSGQEATEPGGSSDPGPAGGSSEEGWQQGTQTPVDSSTGRKAARTRPPPVVG